MHGEATLVFKNGKIYEGMFKENKMQGIGLMTWNSEQTKKKYLGFFKENKRSGLGFLITNKETHYGKFDVAFEDDNQEENGVEWIERNT